MPLYIDKNKVVDDTIFEYEKQLNSKAAVYQETTPTYVTYYHLCEDDTTTDVGFHDVESIIGTRSPVRFKKIEDFPLYGMEQIILQIDDMEQGLDTDFQSEATIGAGLITPLQNSFFKIPYLKGYYLFRVTSVQYDVLIPNGPYKIGYKIESVDELFFEQIDRQLCGSYNCISDNIGTDKHPIIESEYKEKLDLIETMYDDIVDTYITLFYNRVHNVLICEDNGKILYDPLETMFINKHKLFNKENKIETFILSDQFRDSMRKIKYEKSVYRFIERRNPLNISDFLFTLKSLTSDESTFTLWGTENVYYIDIPISRCEANILCTEKMFSDEFVKNIEEGVIPEYGSYGKVIATYLLKSDMSIDDIPMDLNQYLIDVNMSLEVFLLTPIILYIIRNVCNEFMTNKKK